MHIKSHPRAVLRILYTDNAYLTSMVPPAVYALPGRRWIRAEISENVVMSPRCAYLLTKFNLRIIIKYGVRSACARVIIACSDNPIALYIISRRAISIANRSRYPPSPEIIVVTW